MLADVHREGAGATTESVSLGAELASVALFAPQGVVVRVDVGRIQTFVAEVALETHLVPLISTGEQLLRRVDGLVASETDVRHGDGLVVADCDGRFPAVFRACV